MTKILLVEDDGQIASYLGELLRAEGFDTQIAGSKKEAGECLLAQAFRSEERRVGKECRSRWSPYH